VFSPDLVARHGTASPALIRSFVAHTLDVFGKFWNQTSVELAET